MIPGKRRWAPAVALLLLLVTACAPRERAPRPPGAPAEIPARATLPSVALEVVARARSLVGTPYRFRGSDPSGFDCSGLTVYLFSSVGLELPRRAEDQVAAGRWVPMDELEPGDLVFFGATREKPRHVGVVTSHPGEPLTMVHASSSQGVVETEILASTYWLERLEQGRRVLPRR